MIQEGVCVCVCVCVCVYVRACVNVCASYIHMNAVFFPRVPQECGPAVSPVQSEVSPPPESDPTASPPAPPPADTKTSHSVKTTPPTTLFPVLEAAKPKLYIFSFCLH